MTLTLTGAGPTSGSFSPLSITGLQAWFKADAGTSTTTDGVAISQWDDQSGNARHAVQATGTNQPLYKAAIQNSLPVVRFDGSNDKLVSTFGTSLSQPNTLFIVATASGTGDNVVDGLDASNRHVLFEDSANHWAFHAGGGVIGAAQTTPTGWIVWCGHFNTVTSTLYKNGASFVTGSVGTNPLTGLTIGDRFALSGGSPLSGDVAEILVYAGTLSANDRTAVTTYLGTKWGITVS